MPKNRTLRAVPTTATDPAKPRTETEEKLWQALRDHPGSTAAALSTAAGIGRSTAPKILTRWTQQGLVTRTPGIADGGRRPADRWSITAPHDQISSDDQPTNDQAIDEQHDNQLIGDESIDVQPIDNGPTADRSVDNLPIYETSAQPEKSQRLAPGALRGMVEDYLHDHPGEHTPNAIGKALHRSAGAVHNALERMVQSGDATRTSDKPKKYALTTTGAASAK